MRLSTVLLLVAFFLLLVGLTSCLDEPEFPVPVSQVPCQVELTYLSETSCPNIDISPNIIYDVEGPDTVYWRGTFSPNDPDEIALILYTPFENQPKRELWRFNLCTGERQFLADQVQTTPSWSVKDWIVFQREDAQVWKVKSNGDSLTQLTFDRLNIRPIWHPGGEKILYWKRQNVLALGKLAIMDEQGQVIQELDSALGGYRTYSWSEDGERFSYGFGGDIIVANLESEILTTVSRVSPEAQVEYLDWVPGQEQIVWTDDTGLYLTNLRSKETQKIRNICEGRSYTFPSVSRNGQVLMLTRIEQELVNATTIRLSAYPVLMYTDGQNERRVPL
jgi:hypothetical protein